VKKYLVIVEKTDTCYSAYSPNLPECGSTGGRKLERNIRDAIEFHIEALKEDDYEVLSRPVILRTSMSLPDLQHKCF